MVHPIPYYFTPSSITVIDDSATFLKSISLGLPDIIHLIKYINPQEALDYFNKQYLFNPLLKRCILVPDDQPADYHAVEMNIQSISNEIYNPNRFSEISVIITDYSMPGLNGLTLLKNIKHKKIKKLLLTGEAGYELAVQAFNENLIDKFILKGEDLINIVNKQITELRFAYYSDLSSSIADITARSNQEIHCLNDPTFIKIFNHIFKDNNIIEYYLLDNQGSFLMLNITGEPTWFIVKSDEEMTNLYDFAVDSKAPQALCDTLQSRSQIPFFYSESDFDTAPADWGKYLHPAQVIEGNHRYYYAIAKGDALYQLDQNALVSYQQFLDRQENNTR